MVIIGAGPVGLSLALGLARHGVSSVVLEKKLRTSRRSKAPAIHVRTREVLRQWGVEDRFLQAGELLTAPSIHSAPGGGRLVRIDFSELERETERPGLLILEQSRTEMLLLEAARETDLVDIRFGAEAVNLSPHPDRPGVIYRQDGRDHNLTAPFILGCDGAGSFVRRALGLPFEGFTYPVRPMLADVRITGARDRLDWPRIRNGRKGLTAAMRLEEGLWRIIRLERGPPGGEDAVPASEITKRVEDVLGPGACHVEWASRFRIHLRAAPRFRDGRILLAGDAAHVHSPAGGQGMNAGIQDAHNLAWKLAAALKGGDKERLLASYEAERRPVVEHQVSRYADLATRAFLQSPPALRVAAFALLRMGLMIPSARRRILRGASMIGLRYGPSSLLDGADRSAGVRLPDPWLTAPDGGGVRLYDLIGTGPSLLDVSRRDRAPVHWSAGQVIRIGCAGYRDPTDLVTGLLGGHDGWVLVRPDLHVAWARTRSDDLEDLAAWALGSQTASSIDPARLEI